MLAYAGVLVVCLGLAAHLRNRAANRAGTFILARVDPEYDDDDHLRAHDIICTALMWGAVGTAMYRCVVTFLK
jgi:hypothetical protein